jgi:hypothetical protein
MEFGSTAVQKIGEQISFGALFRDGIDRTKKFVSEFQSRAIVSDKTT